MRCELHRCRSAAPGLGKTVQVVALLSHLKHVGVRGPYIVVAPLSTLCNWVNEVRRWTTMNVVMYHGSKERRREIRIQDLGFVDSRGGKHKRRDAKAKVSTSFPIVVTSYDILMRDAWALKQFEWEQLVVDEGHRLKNKDCKLMRVMKEFRTKQRLLLTGTPLQNNLGELWSLLNFLMPDVFSDLEFFLAWFGWDSKDDKEMSTKIREQNEEFDLVSKLHQIMKPFMMRRLKVDVETSLPDKHEIVVYAPMTDHQRFYYDKIMEGMGMSLSLSCCCWFLLFCLSFYLIFDPFRPFCLTHSVSHVPTTTTTLSLSLSLSLSASLMKGLEQTGSSGKRQRLQNKVMQLRKACNHPFLFENDAENAERQMLSGTHTDEGIVSCAGKMVVLDKILKRCKAEGRRVLVFSQFTSVLDIMEDYCWLRGWGHTDDIESRQYCRLDGSVKLEDRQKQIEAFNDPKSNKFVFFISTRAGGVGINLTAADTVVIFDSDWNPHMDSQAQVRLYLSIYLSVCLSFSLFLSM